MPLATGPATFIKTIGIVRVSRWRAAVAAVEVVAMMSGCKPTNSCARALGPTQVRKRLCERREATLVLRIVFVARHEHADAPHAPALLRAR